MVSPVQMCGFEGNNVADLRADFGIFADTKHQELPGACRTTGVLSGRSCKADQINTFGSAVEDCMMLKSRTKLRVVNDGIVQLDRCIPNNPPTN